MQLLRPKPCLGHAIFRVQHIFQSNQLYNSVSPDVKYQCTNQNCKTVSDAVEVFARYEAILGDTQEKTKSNVRMVNETIQEVIQSILMKIGQFLQM
jgi:hypothetical protein